MRAAIHVGNRTFSDGADVEKYLREDTLQSVKPWLVEIMDHYKVSRGPEVGRGSSPELLGHCESRGLLFSSYFTSSIQKHIIYSSYQIEKKTFFILLLWIVLFIVS